MRVYVCVYIGRLKIENGRFYWWTEHQDAKTGRNRWHMWDRITTTYLRRCYARNISQKGKTL